MPESKLSYILTSFFLTLSLAALILSMAVAGTVGNASQTKDLLRSSGIYEAIIPAQLAEAQKNNPAFANIPLQNAEVQKLLATSVDSQQLRAEGDGAVESIYAWLEGKSTRPQLAIDVTADPQALAASLSNLAARRAATLPACVPGVDDYSGFAGDPISATCLPPGITPDVVGSYITQAVQNNPALAATTQIKEEDVKLSNGKTIMESLNSAPVWYQRAQWIPTVSLWAAAFFALLMIIVLRPVRGVRYAGKHLLAVGITLAAVAYGLAWCLDKFYNLYAPETTNPNIGEAVARLSSQFNTALRDNIVELSLIAAGSGLVLYLVAVLAGKFHRKPATRPAKPAGGPAPEPVSLGANPAATSYTSFAAPAKKVKGAPALPKEAPVKRKAPAKRKPAARKSSNKQ